jgi:hypothetical protein
MRIGSAPISVVFPTSVNMNATIKGAALDVTSDFGFSFIVRWTGSPVGTLSIQASNYVQLGSEAPPEATFSTDPVATLAVSAAGEKLFNIADPGYRFVRLVWTFTSGTGTFTVAQFNSKGF